MNLIFTFSILYLLLSVKAQQPCPEGQAELNGECKLCPPGTFSTSRDKTCKQCPKGTFQPFRGAGLKQFCRECPVDSFSNVTAATSCIPCPPGSFAGRFHSKRKCRTCKPGQILDHFNSPFPDSTCESCQPGYYANNNQCVPCPDGLSSRASASTINDCKPCQELKTCPICRPNTYRVASHCVPCPGGMFTKTEGATNINHCIPCPAGTFLRPGRYGGCRTCLRGLTSAPGASMCRRQRKPCPKGTVETNNNNCLSCDKGFRYDPAKETCIQCEHDEISPGGLVRKCRKCPPDRYKTTDGECRCLPGTFSVKNRPCKKCPVGQYLRVDIGNRCRPCNRGFFNNMTGQSDCQRCPMGQVSEKGATGCTNCLDGLVPSTDSTIGRQSFEEGKCVRITDHCRPGTERIGKGSSTSCQKIICTSGTPVADIGKTCTPCPKGRVLDESGTIPKCVKCPDDSVSEGGLQTKCSKCKKGFVQSQSRRNQCICSGQAARGKGVQNGFCKLCPGGTDAEDFAFSSRRNATCQPCPPGTFKPDSDGPSNIACIVCRANTFSTGGATECTPCPPGFITKRLSSTKPSDCVRF